MYSIDGAEESMSRTILLADDSLTIQKVVELTFADTDYGVVAVSSGDELLLQLPECNPDIVICDVIMPGRDGYDVCQEIKSNPGSLHLPVILLTGTFEPFDRDRALAAGCSEIITKPFEARKLVEAVEKLAGGQAVETISGSTDAPDFGNDEEPIPVSGEAIEHDFGTHLADESDSAEGGAEELISDHEEELEFTSSGFAEMEEAGREQQEASFAPPEDGLEFEFPSESELEEDELTEPLDEQAFADTGPLPESLPLTPEELSAEDVAGAMGDEEDDTPFADIEEVEEEPIAGADEVEELPPDTEYYEERMTEPIETMPELGTEETGWREVVPEGQEEVPSEDAPEIDTQDVTEEVAQLAEKSGEALSDDDVDRIARRLLELSGERIEQIAWDVIPDMAELVVRERVREIEEEAGKVPAEPTQ
jgi:CheY-like chemotaxis protein